MKSNRKNTKYSEPEVDRNTIRYTYRTQAVIYDYLYKTAEEKGIPINTLLDYIVSEYKKKMEEGETNGSRK